MEYEKDKVKLTMKQVNRSLEFYEERNKDSTPCSYSLSTCNETRSVQSYHQDSPGSLPQATEEAGPDGAGHYVVPWGTVRGEAIFLATKKYCQVGNPPGAPSFPGHWSP